MDLEVDTATSPSADDAGVQKSAYIRGRCSPGMIEKRPPPQRPVAAAERGQSTDRLRFGEPRPRRPERFPGVPMTEKKFASQADLVEKKISFDKLSDRAYAYTAEGDPNTGVVVGDNAVMVIDTQATPVMAQDVIRRIREVTDKPIRYVVLSHYHAVRVLG